MFLALAALSVVTLAGIGALWVEDSRGASEHKFMRLPDRTDNSPYSDAVLVGDTLYLAGDIGIDPKTGPPAENRVQPVRGSRTVRCSKLRDTSGGLEPLGESRYDEEEAVR